MRRLPSLTLPGLLLAIALAGCSLGGATSPAPTATTVAATAPAATGATITTGGGATAVTVGATTTVRAIGAGAAATTAATPPARTTGGAPTPATTTARATGTGTAPRTPTRAASPGTPLPALPTGQTYRDPQGRFSFTIPETWTQAPPAGSEVAYRAPTPEGVVPGTVNVVLEKLPSAAVTLDEYDQAGEQNLRQQFPDYRPISLSRVTVDGKPAYKRVYTATVAGRLMQIQQIYLIDNDTAYIISSGAPQDTFGNYTTIFDQISGTFKVGTR